MKRDELREEIKQCKPYRQYRRILKAIRNQFDPADIEREARSLHAARRIRSLEPKSINQKNMIEASLREVQGRARLVEIEVSLLSHKMRLEELVDAVRKYLYSEFSGQTTFKYKEDRKSYFGRYFRKADELMAEIEFLLTMCERFIKDIDQAGYKITNFVALLEMIYQRERTI